MPYSRHHSPQRRTHHALRGIFGPYHGKYPGLGLQGDPGRIAGQAITGIGFLGAGVIIRYKDTIRGLTTAACVWLVCSVDLAVGAGFYVVGVAVTLQTLLALIGLKAGERRMRKDWFEDLQVVSTDLPGQITLVKSLIILCVASLYTTQSCLGKGIDEVGHLRAWKWANWQTNWGGKRNGCIAGYLP